MRFYCILVIPQGVVSQSLGGFSRALVLAPFSMLGPVSIVSRIMYIESSQVTLFATCLFFSLSRELHKLQDNLIASL